MGEPVVEISICDDGKRKNNDDVDGGELDHSLSWIRHVQFMNDCQLMILRGSQSIAVHKQVQFIQTNSDNENDEHFVGKVVLENVSSSFDTKSNDVIMSANQYEQEQSVQVDEDLTVLHVADSTRANPKMYEVNA